MTTKKAPIVIITGANGFVGSNLVDAFSKKGWHVRALVRQVGQEPPKPGVQYFKYSLEKPFNEPDIFKEADYLVHTAYVKYSSKNPDAFNINLKAAERLLKASRSYKLKHNVFMSSMSAHDGAESVYGKQKVAIEKLFNTSRDTALRSGLIVGDGGIVKQMSGFMKSKHIVPLVGGGKQPLQIIAVYDLINVIEQVLVKNIPGLFTVATPKVYLYKDFYVALSKHMKTPVLFVPVPFFALVSILDLVKMLHLPLDISKDNALGLKNLISVNTSKDLATIGVKLDSLETALKRTI